MLARRRAPLQMLRRQIHVAHYPLNALAVGRPIAPVLESADHPTTAVNGSSNRTSVTYARYFRLLLTLVPWPKKMLLSEYPVSYILA